MLRLCLLALAMACTMAGATRALEVKAAVLRIDQDALLPISRLDLKPDDMGFAGGVLATEDNQTTGTFLGMD